MVPGYKKFKCSGGGYSSMEHLLCPMARLNHIWGKHIQPCRVARTGSTKYSCASLRITSNEATPTSTTWLPDLFGNTELYRGFWLKANSSSWRMAIYPFKGLPLSWYFIIGFRRMSQPSVRPAISKYYTGVTTGGFPAYAPILILLLLCREFSDCMQYCLASCGNNNS